MTTTLDERARVSRGFKTLVAASCFGTSIEWYDFFLYGFLGPLVFDKLFFPSLSPFLGQLVVFATLTIGFAARPIGGVLFGELGDRIGRKPVLFLALCLMGVCTAAMGLLPGYAVIGPAAPVLLVLLRFLQGLALGGQFAGAMVITVESAPSHRRGFYGAIIQTAGYIGVIVATGAIALLSMLSKPDLMAWGWRLPFLASIVLVGVAIYVRAKVDESAAFEQDVVARKVKRDRTPVLDVIIRYPGRSFIVMLLSAAETGFYYLVSVFALAYGSRTLGHPQGYLANAVALGATVSLFTTPLFGHCSDRIGRRPMFLAGTLAAALYIYVFFAMMKGSDLSAALAIGIGVAFIHPLMYAPEGSFLAELFETKVRMTGMSLGKQVGATLGAGLAPFIAAWIIGASHGQTIGVVIYYVIMAALAFAASLAAKETAKASLHEPLG